MVLHIHEKRSENMDTANALNKLDRRQVLLALRKGIFGIFFLAGGLTLNNLGITRFL